MYLGRRNILHIDRYNEKRKDCIATKSGAVFTAFTELENLINMQELAKQYFPTLGDITEVSFDSAEILTGEHLTKEEYHQLAEALRDIAKRLQAHADEIDAAEFE
ncbi:MAG: hypothetical protein IJ280_07205 [Bacteroidales bacterium]|nr:hypothetical protein [Bacteroidales bacterium]